MAGITSTNTDLINRKLKFTNSFPETTLTLYHNRLNNRVSPSIPSYSWLTITRKTSLIQFTHCGWASSYVWKEFQHKQKKTDLYNTKRGYVLSLGSCHCLIKARNTSAYCTSSKKCRFISRQGSKSTWMLLQELLGLISSSRWDSTENKLNPAFSTFGMLIPHKHYTVAIYFVFKKVRKNEIWYSMYTDYYELFSPGVI